MVDADHPEHEPDTAYLVVGSFGPSPSPSVVDPRAAFRTLPERVAPADMVAVRDTEAPPDPTMGRDSDHEYMLRYI